METATKPIAVLFLAVLALFIICSVIPKTDININFSQIDANNHSVDRHKYKAVVVAKAITCNGSLFQMLNPFNNRKANVCLIEGKFGILITEENNDPVTFFLKEKMNDVKQVIQYLQNRGYIFP